MLKQTIRQLQNCYQEKNITVEEVVDQVLASAKKHVHYNCWIYLLEKKEIMAYVDKLPSPDFEEKPLWGIPFAIKDNIDLAHVPTTAACPEFSYIPEKSARVVAQLLHAGAIPIGKTDMDQFATGLVGTRSPYGATKNALDPELISGGSSSGSAVAVALGQICFALGTDTAGSGRVPAALNNIFGYKAAPGCYSTEGVVPACESLDCVSIFARGMEDICLIDQQLNTEKVVPSNPNPKPEKLLLPDEVEFFGPYAAMYEAAWQKTVKYFRESAHVETIEMAQLQQVARSLYEGPFVVERDVAIGEFADLHSDSIVAPLATILKQARQADYSAKALFEAQHVCKRVERSLKNKLADSLLILPTCTGTWRIDQVLADPLFTNSQMGLYTNHCNLLGLSATAVPAPVASEMPFGITLFSTPEDEPLLRSFASELDSTEARTELVVCGLHMRGFPLEKEMRAHGAEFAYETKTSSDYLLYELHTEPRKPGLFRSNECGQPIDVEVWRIPDKKLSQFIQTIPYPLAIGKVVLENGVEKLGFVCQKYSAEKKKNITHYGSWRNYQKELQA